MPLSNTYGAVWTGTDLPNPPLDVQITNGAGTSLVAGHCIQNGTLGDVPTTVQFTPGTS